MKLDWIHENPPHWDAAKARIIGAEPEGTFHLGEFEADALLPGEWWRVEADGETVGYGWMDTTWGDAEVLLAVDAGARGRGVGTFILDRLEREASVRGLRYMFNVVRETHPDPEGLTRWLEARKFEGRRGDQLMRRVPNP